MTALLAVIERQIRATGPISLAEYMALCLMHPEHGYYTTRDPFGAAGDFVTAPEISQMFGELIGLSLAQSWLDQGAPKRFTLAEAGPGRGTLMADLLRATAQVPGFHEAMQLCLFEASPTLRILQQTTIGREDIHWLTDLSELPAQPLFLVANEFFDALPIRQFQRHGTLWQERKVGLDVHGKLCFGLDTPTSHLALTYRLEDTRDGDLVETCAPAAAMATEIGRRIAGHGGVALLIDYGDWRSLGDTLQAVAGHKPTDPLATPGAADLTAHVDFEALARATPSKYSRLTTQGIFLERLGITSRARALAKNLTGPALESHIAAHRRLTHPSEMGTVFKTMAFYPEGASPPPGLDA